MTEPLSWEWVAAIFDGEGAISVQVRAYSIDLNISFTQKDRAVLDEMSSFLEVKGVSRARVYTEHKGSISRLIVSSNADIPRVLEGMIPFLRVKRNQVVVTAGYLRDEISGNEYARTINMEILAGRRRGNILSANQPWPRSRGILETRLASMSQARRTYRLLATSTSGKERLRRSAVERNVSTGLRTKRKVLLSISEQPRSTREIGQSIPRSYGHLQRVLRSLTAASLATRDQRSVTAPAIYQITEVGRRYILELDAKLRN